MPLLSMFEPHEHLQVDSIQRCNTIMENFMNCHKGFDSSMRSIIPSKSRFGASTQGLRICPNEVDYSIQSLSPTMSRFNPNTQSLRICHIKGDFRVQRFSISPARLNPSIQRFSPSIPL